MLTVIVYKKDARTKTGERMSFKEDYDTEDLEGLDSTMRYTFPSRQGYRYEIHKTMVKRRNLMTGVEYEERFDTDFAASPSSEAYWSM
jgi:hypothetical protein